jgi:AcrR family transcriptional regulator
MKNIECGHSREQVRKAGDSFRAGEVKVIPYSKGEESRQRLLVAAVAVFARCGFEGGSTREIAQVAGTNIVSIHYYFGNKTNLYYEAVRYSVRELTNQFSEACKRVETWLDKPTLTRRQLRDALLMLIDDTLSIMVGLGDILGPAGRLCWRQDEGPNCAREVAQEKLAPVSRCIREFLSRLADVAPDSEQVQFQSLALIALMTFVWRDRPAILRSLGWEQLDQQRSRQICDALRPLLCAMLSA